MEDAYTKLQKEGKNDVENLIKWMKDSQIIDQTKDQEDKVRSFFDDAVDKNNITLEKFKEVTSKVADEFNANLDEIRKKLCDTNCPGVPQDTPGHPPDTPEHKCPGGACQRSRLNEPCRRE